MKKITKSLLVIMLGVVIIGTSLVQVNAVAQTITLGEAEAISGYVAGVYFSTKTSSTGEPLYCLNIHKTTAKNTTATLVGERDAGVAYILENGYPNKSYTGDRLKDYYITQTAMWWYLDETTGSTNLGEAFKTNGADQYNLRPTIKSLVENAKKAKEKGYAVTKLTLTAEDSGLTLKDGYYTSKEIYAKEYSNISSYTVKVEGAPEGTKIYNGEGEEASTIDVADKFTVKVPVASVTDTNINIKVTATATGVVKKAYEYQPVDSKMQNVTPSVLEEEKTTVNSIINLGASPSKVTVIKIDKSTGKVLPGATLVIKDANGEVMAEWTTTENAHVIRNLAPGTYTVEETQAPAGYAINTQKVTFTIDDENLTHKITFENYPEVIVPNTSDANSIIFTLLGIVIISAGIGFVYKNGKKAK